MKRFLPMVWVGALGIGGALSAQAGNVPQYKTTYALDETFEYLENPTLVNSTFSQHSLIFADGLEHNLRANTGAGFPIGFPFRFGGKVFTQFAIDTWGAIYLGTEEEGVVYRGQNTMLFSKNLPLELDKADEFYIGMVKGDVYSRFKSTNKKTLNAQIGYELTGKEGDRVLTVEFRNYAPQSEKQSSAGHYDLQIRLYEKDNHFEIAFNEAETAKSTYAFTVGARGYEIEDAILLQSPNLGTGAEKSNVKYTEWDSNDGKVIWDGPNDYNKYYKPVFGFYAETDATAPAEAPKNLSVVQDGGVAHVSVDRAEGADATVLLFSEKPFTDDDYPTNGETFRSQGKMGDFVTKIGDATVMYYGDAEHIEVDIDGIEASKDYYIVAISANGYPAFNTGNKATTILTTSQAAPDKFSAKAAGQTKIGLSMEAENDVIIAVTDQCSHLWKHEYEGIFGRPDADAKVGDELEGGGTVIYVGPAEEFVWEDAPTNIMNYFAAWTVKDGRVSALYAEAHTTTEPSLPYEPKFENYPSSVVPEILDATTRQGDELGVFTRVYDDARVLRLRLVNGATLGFYLPELNLAKGDAELTFEYAMETSRGFGEVEPSEGDTGGTSGPTVQIPLGYKPGEFGSGSLDVNLRTGGNVEKVMSITEYNGTMESNGDGGYQECSSTFDTVTVPLSDYTGVSNVGISASASEFSYIFIRNIKVNGTDIYTGINAAEVELSTVIEAGKGEVSILSADGDMIEIYSVDGRKVAGVKAPAGEQIRVSLPAGLYIANGKKLLVR